MRLPENTSLSSWDKVSPGNLIYFKDKEIWVGPYLVVNPSGKEVRDPNLNISTRVENDEIALVEGGTPNSNLGLTYLGDPLDPVPAKVPGQEHNPNPIGNVRFDSTTYTTAKQALKLPGLSEVEKMAHSSVIQMWEKATAILKSNGESLSHIDLLPGGELRVYPNK